MKYFYGVLCLLGAVLPYSALIAWITENGFNAQLLLSELVASRIGLFAWLDVLVSALVLIGFIFYEGAKIGMKLLWLPFVATCLVGVSLGLPLFLLLRELHLDKQGAVH